MSLRQKQSRCSKDKWIQFHYYRVYQQNLWWCSFKWKWTFLWGYMSSFFSFETESRWESDANPKAPTRAFYLPWAFATFCRRSFWQHYPDFSTQNTSLLELKSRSLITRNPSRDYYSLPPWLKSRGKSSIIFLWLLSNEYVVQSANHKMSFSQPSKTKKENPSQPNII